MEQFKDFCKIFFYVGFTITLFVCVILLLVQAVSNPTFLVVAGLIATISIGIAWLYVYIGETA